MAAELTLRAVAEGDLDALHALEQQSFATDRLSRRRLRHWIGASNRVFLVALRKDPRLGDQLLGYGLVLLHRGTRLARLYSLAVSPAARGQGLGGQILAALEDATAQAGRLYLRLEVAEDNQGAIGLYRARGYTVFGRYDDYYEDHQPALRMQKRVRYVPANLHHLQVPWYQQTTEFTCGPAALMMAMAALDPRHAAALQQGEELNLWREATTIFMTSGHGGCHPMGLALAARRRGFRARVVINHREPLFVDGVRSPAKKDIVTLVHQQFMAAAKAAGVRIDYRDATQTQLARWIENGALVLALISTYRMDSRKAPHWVTMTAVDDACFYVHDPDPTENEQIPLDCQYLPIARASFEKMSQFGRNRTRAFVVVEAG